MNVRNFKELFSDISSLIECIVENHEGMSFSNLMSRDNCYITQFTKSSDENDTYIIKVTELKKETSGYTLKIRMTDEQFIRVLCRRIIRNLRKKNVKTFNYFEQVKECNISIIKREGAINGIRIEKDGKIQEDVAKWKGDEKSQYVPLWDGARGIVVKDISIEDLLEICESCGRLSEQVAETQNN